MNALDPDTCWSAVVDRDPNADGRFVYAVRTTGVFCRPSCPSRSKRRENVVFFADNAAAEVAGFRPCKRCRPDRAPDTTAESVVQAACRAIETAESEPSLAELARMTGYSAFHFQRLFKARVGLTPKQYAKAHRRTRLLTELTAAPTVATAIYAAGYEASSRAYADAESLGLHLDSVRRGAPGEHIRFATAPTSLGEIAVAATARGVCLVRFGQPEDARTLLTQRFPQARIEPADESMSELVAAVVTLIDDPAHGRHLPLDIRGTAFQERVWRALTEIPLGRTVSYSELADRIGHPRAVRAVAHACASNVIAVAVPCHRVVRGTGDLAGYRWGLERKRALLEREAAVRKEPTRPARAAADSEVSR
jgi:AraC family transcriptional regulator, regulatory protein of adaptative response / methylated-DNA-[protein]-cysteine methyltransferase